MSGCISIHVSLYAAETGVDEWYIHGSNTVRGSVYDAHGPGANSPYPFEGDMFFDELNMYFNKRDTPYSSWRGEISGVYNLNDDYRSPDTGVVPERLNLTREDGNAGIPYRVELGDFFSYFSYLTVQSSIKGAQLELQPATSGNLRHSIVMFTGANESNWRDLTPGNDYSNGISWLVSGREQGSFSLNLVHNYRDNVSSTGTLERNQYVISASGEKLFSAWGHDYVFEAEAAWFKGDHNGLTGAASGQDRVDTGYFARLRGTSRALPWSYEARFQRYGQDFQPRGAIVSSDRRSIELFNNWRFDSSVLMRLRLQLFEDAFETNNELRTRTYGINFTGPVLSFVLPEVTGRIDAFIQNRNNELRTVDQLTRSLTASLNRSLPYDWNGRLSIFVQNVDDQTPTNSDLFTRQLVISADHSINLLGFQGYITPGILLRTLRQGRNDSNDLRPTFAMSLERNNHRLRMDVGGLIQNRLRAANSPDVETYTLNMDYQYRKQQHTFGLEANLFGREQDGIDSTSAYRVSAFWTYEFDKPARQVAARTVSPIGAEEEPPESGTFLTPGLSGLPLLSEREEVESALDNATIENGVKQGDYIVYETALLSDVLRRQRLALQYSAGLLNRAAYIIDFADVGDQQTVTQTFERVRQSLIRELGQPTRTYEEGEFSAQFVRDVNEQRLVRITEWNTFDGVIRFGIPRRLDGQVRMEIQRARSFPPPGDTLWSIESIK